MSTVDYGTDLSCIFDLSPTLGQVSGRMLLVEAIVRRITTARGTVLDDPDYGIDVREWLNDSTTAAGAKQRAAQISAEIEKDDRVISAKTEATFIQGVLSLSVYILESGGPFRLNLSISDTSVDVLSVT